MQFDEIFYPKSVAIIGASPETPFFIKPLLEPEYKGKLFLVNPNRQEVFGLKCYPSILEVEEPVDYVIFSVPARYTPDVLKDCVKKGVKAVHIFTSGFSESGKEEGKRLEEELLKIADGKLRIIGPNCMGIYCPESGMAFIPGLSKESGDIGFVSQSGAHAEHVPLTGMLRGLKFSKVISYGNGIDLESSDFIEYLGVDPKTKVILVYIEGIKDGRKFMESLKKVTVKKPTVVLKGGRTKDGARSASSHTGSLAGSTEIWNALFSQTGVIPVKSIEELLDTTLAISYCPLPEGKNISMITFSGGSSVIQTDACIEMGLNVPIFSERTMKELEKVTASVGGGIKNPLDSYYSYFGPNGLLTVVKIIASEENINSLMLEISATYTRTRNEELYSEFIRNVIESHRYTQDEKKKPFMIALPATRFTEEREKLQETFQNAGIAVYPTIDRAAKSIFNMYRYREFLDSSNLRR
ncbi:MAG: CoA-binding protein [Halobacteriota archaeon]|nr:CoA-binding protein [Halobacteriota archaeon]